MKHFDAIVKAIGFDVAQANEYTKAEINYLVSQLPEGRSRDREVESLRPYVEKQMLINRLIAEALANKFKLTILQRTRSRLYLMGNLVSYIDEAENELKLVIAAKLKGLSTGGTVDQANYDVISIYTCLCGQIRSAGKALIRKDAMFDEQDNIIKAIQHYNEVSKNNEGFEPLDLGAAATEITTQFKAVEAII